jgi:hypothetical protein
MSGSSNKVANAGRFRRSVAWSTSQARILASLTLLAMVLRAPFEVWGDTWFNLVLGREIESTGLIERNNLTQEGFGASCVDQQWLAHRVYYEIATHFGLVGVVMVTSVVTSATFLAAVWFALEFGATPGRTLALGVVALGVVMSQTLARAQTLALPFMCAFPLALSQDARSASRKTWWLVPCAMVWANLHGSVLLAPAMGGLLLVGRVGDALRRREAVGCRVVLRDFALAASLFAAVFASPYAGRLPAYYRSTVANPAFRAYITEWQAPSPSEAPAALLLSVIGLLLVVRCFRAMPLFDSSLAVLLATGTLTAVRYATPLALMAAALLPRWADAALGRLVRFESDRVLETLSRFLVPIALAAFAAIPLLAARALRVRFPPDFTDRVASASIGRGFILSDEAHADRLLWFHPELKGRVSHDARVETIPGEFLRSLASAYAAPDALPSRKLLENYEVVVVDRELHARLFESMNRDSRWELLASDRLASAYVFRDAVRENGR